MASIKKDFIDSLKRRIDSDPNALLDVITGLTGKGKREGSTYRTTCPLCGSQHGLTITPAKKIYKCFSCGNLSGKDPISFLMTVRKDTYPEAIEYLASHYGMVVEYEEERKKAKKSEASNFCKRMLTQSGLTYADVTATVKEGDNEAVTTLRTFISGTLTKDGAVCRTVHTRAAVAVLHIRDGVVCRIIGCDVCYKHSRHNSVAFRVHINSRHF